MSVHCCSPKFHSSTWTNVSFIHEMCIKKQREKICIMKVCKLRWGPKKQQRKVNRNPEEGGKGNCQVKKKEKRSISFNSTFLYKSSNSCFDPVQLRGYLWNNRRRLQIRWLRTDECYILCASCTSRWDFLVVIVITRGKCRALVTVVRLLLFCLQCLT